jgi:hypothetical protein
VQNKKIAAVVSRLKYTQIELRATTYENRATHMSRAPLLRDFIALSRAAPGAMAKMLEEDRLILDLRGMPCPRKACHVSSKKGFVSSDKVLGRRCCNNERGLNIGLFTVWHKCDCCGVRQSIGLHNPLYAGFIGRSSWGITYATLAMWNCVEGATQSFTVRQLNIGERACRSFYDRACIIMAAEAIRLQKDIVWGVGSSKTVEVELDATVICKWKVVEAGHVIYDYYCYMGARQRGDLSKYALMPLGISRSVDEGRVNPEGKEAYHAFCEEVFGDKKSNLLSMTDGAPTYRCRCERCTLWFEEHHWVNHSRKPMGEFSRPLEAVLSDVATGEKRAGMAGTMTLDKEWGLTKAPLPKNLAANTAAAIERCDMLVRAQQFRRMTSNGDRWAAFLEGARRWIVKRSSANVVGSVPVGRFARELSGKMRRERTNLANAKEEGDISTVVLREGEAAALDAALSETSIVGAEAASARHLLMSSASAKALEDKKTANDAVLDKRARDVEMWGGRYFETQEEMKCGRHALNNLLGGPQFLDVDMVSACDQVCDDCGEHQSLNATANGWYSHSVLAKAFDMTYPPLGHMLLVPASGADYERVLACEDYYGFIVNQNNLHWVCMAIHDGFLFYVDSCHYPTAIDYKDFCAILLRYPMAFLVEKQVEKVRS